MADSPAFQSATPATLPAGVAVSTEEVTTLNGGAVAAQHVQRFLAAFRTADGTAVDLPGDGTNGLDVDVTRVQGTVAVSGPLTDTQLRASRVPVDGSGVTQPVSGSVSVGNFPATQPVSLATNTPDVTDRSARLLGHVTVDSAPTTAVTGPLTDAQLRAAAVPVSGTFFQGTQPVSAASLPLPSGAATEATLDARTGALTETAPATDTASSGLNGRLQRVAQRVTSLIALLPSSLGQKSMANGLAVTVASDQSALPASQSGTWTVQPGNTANTTAWKVDGSAVTQPVSGTVTVNALPAGTNNIGDVDVLTMPTVASPTVTQVASSASNVTLKASNGSRKGLLIFNDSTAILRVKFGATASATSYTVQIAAGGYYEMPQPVYTGIVDGIWAAANGNAYVTELV
jgi:hypothetical protein